MMVDVAPPAQAPDPWLSDLYRTHHRDLVRLATLLLDDQGAAEEVVQDAFVAVSRRSHLVDDLDARAAYLRSAVLNNARSLLRKRAVRRRHLARAARPADAPAADQAVLLDDDCRRVLDALRRLSVRQREVLVLRYWAELSEAEIADSLGISPGSVKTHAHRGLAALADLLEAP